MTPIESRAHWAIHRKAADFVRSNGGHFGCATEIGFIAVERVTGEAGEFKPAPCARCLAIYQQQQQNGKDAA